MTFIIGEIGINHNGKLEIAKKIIKVAKDLGFDAVKFQKRSPDISTPDNQKNKLRETPWGVIKYLDYKKKIEFNKSEYDKIDKYCKKIKINWFASAWDLESLKFLDKYKLKFHKISSAMLTNYELLEEVAKRRKFTFISTGGANLNEISKAVKIFKKKKCKFTLMHSVSIYPCEDQMLNLGMIKKLKKIFKCNIGYSGHEASVTPSLIAVALGATALERHITIDRTLWGSDQSASLGPDGMRQLVQLVRKISTQIGDGNKKFIRLEKKKLSTMQYWK